MLKVLKYICSTDDISMDIAQLLIDIGLSDKESKMYLTLLRHDEQATSFLAKKADFNRGTAYVVLPFVA